MLVKDLRKTLEKYDKKEMTDIIAELYKRLPKKVKKDYDIDKFIEDINTKTKKEEKNWPIIQKSFSTLYFCHCFNYWLKIVYKARDHCFNYSDPKHSKGDILDWRRKQAAWNGHSNLEFKGAHLWNS